MTNAPTIAPLCRHGKEFMKLTVINWFVRSVNQQVDSVAAAFDQGYSISVWNIFCTSSIDF